MPSINLDAILSDPMLLTAAILLAVGPLVFIFSLIKFMLLGRKKEIPILMEDSVEPTPPPQPQPELPPYMKEEVIPEPPPPPARVQPKDPDKTIVMTHGIGELQGQLEIAFSQIKTLNKKVYQLESDLESVSRTTTAKLESHELKEPPANPGDFMQKLLKLAEHVIVLEKEVSRLKIELKKSPPANGNAEAAPAPAEPTEPQSPKPPVMPI